MTYDDGILGVYNTVNLSTPGDMPVIGLELKDRYYFGYDNIGVTRNYLAKQAMQDISAVVNIPDWNDVKVTDVVLIEERDDIQYQVDFVQPQTDENGLRMMKLTLREVGQTYEVPGEDKDGSPAGE